MTTYVYQTTITVTVHMADEGEQSESDGEIQHWDSPAAQEESAREWAEEAMPLHETYGEEFVEVNVPDLRLVAPPAQEETGGEGER